PRIVMWQSCLGQTLIYFILRELSMWYPLSFFLTQSFYYLLQISGEWYSILLASDHKEKIEENGSMRVFVERIQPLENSSLYFKYHTIINGECSEIPLVCDLTGKDGECSVDYDGHNVATILDTDYTDYLIYHVKNSENEEKSQIMELYGREPDVSPELKEKFVEYCEKYGIVKENILDLTKVGKLSYLAFSS
uniref:Lipocalin/cytosolic fatty-acid binding domain-containing protein n=1 Tax=Prolemur simus TaxID=1328070 RepID=A0A8C9ATE0_PROSS